MDYSILRTARFALRIAPCGSSSTSALLLLEDDEPSRALIQRAHEVRREKRRLLGSSARDARTQRRCLTLSLLLAQGGPSLPSAAFAASRRPPIVGQELLELGAWRAWASRRTKSSSVTLQPLRVQRLYRSNARAIAPRARPPAPPPRAARPRRELHFGYVTSSDARAHPSPSRSAAGGRPEASLGMDLVDRHTPAVRAHAGPSDV